MYEEGEGLRLSVNCPQVQVLRSGTKDCIVNSLVPDRGKRLVVGLGACDDRG